MGFNHMRPPGEKTICITVLHLCGLHPGKSTRGLSKIKWQQNSFLFCFYTDNSPRAMKWICYANAIAVQASRVQLPMLASTIIWKRLRFPQKICLPLKSFATLHSRYQARIVIEDTTLLPVQSQKLLGHYLQTILASHKHNRHVTKRVLKSNMSSSLSQRLLGSTEGDIVD